MKKTNFALTALTVAFILFCAFPAQSQEKEKTLYPVLHEGKWGYINPSGKLVIKPQYNDAQHFSEELAVVKFTDGYWGYIDTAGKRVTKENYVGAADFREGMARVRVSTGDECRWGYIDKTGKQVIKAQFDKAADFSEGLAAVVTIHENKDKAGKVISYYYERNFIDKTGKVAIKKAKSTEICNFHEGLARFRSRKGKWGFVDKEGKVVVEAQYDEVWDFSEGIALVKSGGRGGKPIASEGALPRPDKEFYERMRPSREPKGKFGYIDKTGKVILPPQYETASSFSEGAAIVKLKDKYGFVGTKGKLIIEAKYDSAYNFSDGLAAVKAGKKWGYIDMKGSVVIKPQFDSASCFHNGLVAVSLGESLLYIDKKGKTFWKAENVLETAKKALEEKRFYDAFKAVNRVLKLNPDNPAAGELVRKIWNQTMRKGIDCAVCRLLGEDKVTLTVGRQDGVKKGIVFIAYSGIKEVGRARVIEVENDLCTAEFFEKKRSVKLGDHAASGPELWYWKDR
jgi:hypothetical protein